MPDEAMFDRDDHPNDHPNDDTHDIESLLRELETEDGTLVAPPADLWAGIEAAIGEERSIAAIASRRSRLRTRILATAAAVALLAAGVAVVSSLRSDDTRVVASADLTYDPEAFDPLGANASATARLVDSDGGFEIRLEDASLPDPQTDDLELWLISSDANGEVADIQPVALVDAAEPGTYAVPAELDPDVYSIVDISIEPRDGDEAHSGRSILRGTLDV